MLKDWGIIFKGDGYENIVFNDTGFQTRVAGVVSVEKAVEVAQVWAEDGIQLIELCGWFGEEGADKLVEAVGDRVAVGYVIDRPKTKHLMEKISAD